MSKLNKYVNKHKLMNTSPMTSMCRGHIKKKNTHKVYKHATFS